MVRFWPVEGKRVGIPGVGAFNSNVAQGKYKQGTQKNR